MRILDLEYVYGSAVVKIKVCGHVIFDFLPAILFKIKVSFIM